MGGFSQSSAPVAYATVPASAATETIYVGKGASASDANAGTTPGAPKATYLAALAALAASGGVVKLLYGTFGGITSEITYPTNVITDGLGPGLSVLQAAQVTWTASTALLHMTDTSNAALKNLTVDGNWDGNTSTPKGAINGLLHHTTTVATSNNRLENVWFINASSNGVNAHGDTNGILQSDLTATDVYCVNNGKSGFIAQLLTSLTVRGGSFSMNGLAYAGQSNPGMSIQGGTKFICTGAKFVGNGSHGFTTATPGSGTTTLSAGIDNAVTTIPLTTAIHTIANDTILLVGSEQMLVTGGADSASLTVTRGYNGTTAASHSLAAAVTAYWSAPMEQLVITGCIATGNGAARVSNGTGINLSVAARYFNVDNNICIGNWLNQLSFDLAAGLVSGLKGWVVPAYGTVVGNICAGAVQGSGMFLNYLAYATVGQNVCVNNSDNGVGAPNGCGLVMVNCYGCNIAPNVLQGNSQYGLYQSPNTMKLGAAVTTNGQTTFTLTSSSGTTPIRNGTTVLLIESEQVLVTAGSGGSSLTVTRAYNGTSAATHANGTTLKFFSGYMRLLNVEVVDGNHVVGPQIAKNNGAGNYFFDPVVTGNQYATTSATPPS